MENKKKRGKNKSNVTINKLILLNLNNKNNIQ